MRSLHILSGSVLALLAGGCVGSLDESAFNGGSYGASTAREEEGVASEEQDRDVDDPEAGPPQRDAGALQEWEADAAVSTGAMDAAVSDAKVRWLADAWTAETSLAEASVADASPAPVDAPAAVPDTGTGCDFRALITAKCGSAGCHGAGAVSSGLDLASANLATRVAGKKASGACASYLLIDSEQPERSALYLKVTADSCGSRMPLGGTLTDKEQLCILQWVENL
jgi:hypothetical protein